MAAGGAPAPVLAATLAQAPAARPPHRRQGRSRRRVAGACWLLLVLWLLLPPLEIYLVSLLVPVFLDRYLIWVMPAFVTLLACGVVALYGAWRPLGLATLARVLAFNLLGVWLQTANRSSPTFARRRLT